MKVRRTRTQRLHHPRLARILVQRQHVPGLFQMRLVEHLAVERGDAGAGRERCHHPQRVIDIGGRRREGGVDEADLVGMDGEHAAEAFALGGPGGAGQPCRIAEIRMQRVDGFDTGGFGCDQRQERTICR